MYLCHMNLCYEPKNLPDVNMSLTRIKQIMQKVATLITHRWQMECAIITCLVKVVCFSVELRQKLVSYVNLLAHEHSMLVMDHDQSLNSRDNTMHVKLA